MGQEQFGVFVVYWNCNFVLPGSITPIFTLSSVSGESLELLKIFLNIIPPLSNTKEQEELMEQLTEFQVCLRQSNQLEYPNTNKLSYKFVVNI